MFKRLLSFVFLSIAVWTLSSGLVLLFAWQQLLNSDFYKKSFIEADFYNQTATPLEKNIPVLMEDNFNIDEEGEFGPRLMSKFIPTLLEKIDLTGILQLVVEENSENLTDWLKGREELEVYFPKTALVESYKEDVGDDQFFQDFLETSGFYELPSCSTAADLFNLSSEDTGLSCQSPLVELELQQKLKENFPSGADNLAEGFLASMIPEFDEKTPVTQFDLTETQVEQLESIPRYVRIPLYLSIGMLVFSAISTVISAKLSLSPKKVVIRVFLYSGILLTGIGTLLLLSIQTVINFILGILPSAGSQNLNKEQLDQVINTVANLMSELVGNLLMGVIWVGVSILALSVVIWVGEKMFSKISDNRNTTQRKYT